MMKIMILLMIPAFIISCARQAGAPTSKQLSDEQDSVQQMMKSIANDVSGEGPIAWLKYFENSSDFFMVSDGQLVFPTSDSATAFIKNILIKNMTGIQLQWSNIRIDPLTDKFASIAASFHEDITFASGTKSPANGYFTGIACHTARSWQLQNAHWSTATTP